MAGVNTNLELTIARGWAWARVGMCLARLQLFSGHMGLAHLVDRVVNNAFFPAVQVPSELCALGKILQSLRPKCAIEIGTYRGGTLYFLTRLADPRATIISIDLPGGGFGGGYGSRRAWLYRRMARPGQRIHTLRGDSHSGAMVERARRVLRHEPLDYLFIDGDHTYDGVKRDFELYAPFVRRGGIIVFHDITEQPTENLCEVWRLWNQVKAHYRYSEIVEDPRQGWAGIGVLFID